MRDVEAVPAEPARRSGRSPVRRVLSGSPEQRRLLALQRTVGNAVVARAAEEGVELSELGGPAPAPGRAGPSAPTHSLEVGFPPRPLPERQSGWSQLFCCGTGRRSPDADVADEWNTVLDAAEQDNPRFAEDEDIRFDGGTRTVLVRYDARLLPQIYPKLADVLRARAATLHAEEQGEQGERLPADRARAFARYGQGVESTRGYWEDADEQRVELGRGAAVERAGTAAGAVEPPDPMRGRPSVPSLDLLREVLQEDGRDGLLIGERHTDPSAYLFLANNLEAAKSFGLRTIYLEILRVGDIQRLVDEYVAGEQDQMPDPLTSFLASLKNPGPERLLRAVRQVGGVRIRGVDSFNVQSGFVLAADPEDGEPWARHERTGLMNAFAAREIERDQAQHPGAYAAVVGESHARDHRFGGSRAGLVGVDYPTTPELPDLIPGLTRYLGVPAIRLNGPDEAISIHPGG